ncbi:MAG: DNA polymerase III subunit beta, partial [Anaerolineae bacterium]
SEGYEGPTSGEDIKAVVPGRALNEIARIASEASDTCFEIGSGQVFFDVGRIRIMSRLLEGQFPPYRQIIPSSFVTTARVQTSALHDAVERASLISADDDYAVRLRLSSEGIAVLSASSKVGRAQEAVEAQVEGEEMEIAFNARFLIDGLRAVDAQEILFRTTGRFGPACIRPLEHENFIYVVMPLKTP